MTNDKIDEWHEENLSELRRANGNRNTTLNTQALKSFGLAKGDDNLSIAKVESDFTSVAKALGLSDNEIKKTLASALSAATAYSLNGAKAERPSAPASPANLALAPIYTALEDYAQAHGAPVSAFLEAKWSEGTHNGRKCLLVPCEDKVIRARFLDGEVPKWLPVKTGDTKITPCWYGFNKAVSMAVASKRKTIVLCNGQPSVVVAHHYDIPALAQTDGENKMITVPLLRRLLDAVKEHGLKIMLAYDGDNTGRSATKRIQEQLAANGIVVRVVQFGGDDGYDLADFCRERKSDVIDKLFWLSRFGQKKLQPVLSRSELVNHAHRSLSPRNQKLPAGEMLIMPFKSIAKLGGFAFILHPGRTTMILGPSGGGKTSFMETLGDFWNKKGLDTLSFSPEWSPLSMQYRAIQRYSGVHTDAIASHILHAVEVERGIAEDDRQGIEIVQGSASFEKYNNANDEISKWPGEMYAFQGQKVTSEILEDMSKTIWVARRKGRRPAVAFFDYVQLLRTDQDEKDYSSYELICSEISDWSKDMDIHAVIGSQPTKSVGENSIRTGALLNEYDAMWMRPDVAQLIITLNIKHNKQGDELIKTDYAIANVCKNNEGQTKAVRLRTNFERLSWIEETRLA